MTSHACTPSVLSLLPYQNPFHLSETYLKVTTCYLNLHDLTWPHTQIFNLVWQIRTRSLTGGTSSLVREGSQGVGGGRDGRSATHSHMVSCPGCCLWHEWYLVKHVLTPHWPTKEKCLGGKKKETKCVWWQARNKGRRDLSCYCVLDD